VVVPERNARHEHEQHEDARRHLQHDAGHTRTYANCTLRTACVLPTTGTGQR
jgi:hypothetical protein